MNPGYYKLNTSTLQILTRAFEANPNGDLEETLQRIYTTYPQLRSQIDRRRARLRGADQPVSVPACRTTRQTLLLPQLPLSIDTALHIDSPLDPRVLSSLSVNLQRYTTSEVAESLLLTLHAREPISFRGRRIIVPLNEGVVVKLGHDIDTEELALLQFLHYRVPTVVAPRGLGYMTVGSISCMFMTRLPGDTLQSRWTTMNVQEKTTVRVLLDNMLLDLRKVDLPNGSPMGSVSDRHTCKDCRRYIRVSADTIYDESHFNEFLTRSVKSRASTGYRRSIVSMLRHDHRILLTHGDLHPGNIIVDTDEQGHMSVGLVDWEMGGFYPEYWEMLKAMNTRAITDSSDWWEFLPQCIMGYDQEIAVDRMIENTLLK